jgi:hypothetical protein
MKDLAELKDELRWAIANNEERPRTELALRWALEALEAMPVIAEAEAKTEEVGL